MNEKKWTPAPWAVIRVDGSSVLMGFGIDNINDAFNKPGPWRSEWMEMPEADAHLISAAPDLHEALSQMLAEKINYMTINDLGNPFTQTTVKLALDALAKARGERHG